MNRTLNDWLVELEGSLEDWEISALNDRSYLDDCFACNLSFGTGGIRGLMGVGPNRMNAVTIGRATQGVASYLNNASKSERSSVAIAYDTRIHSHDFAVKTACVLAGNNIECHLFKTHQPTPLLSYAVRKLGCDAGICITASHNPMEYNGYKVYGYTGDQATDSLAKSIQSQIELVDPFDGVHEISFDTALKSGIVRWIPNSLIESYWSDVLDEIELRDCSNLSVVYSPLGGTGLRHAIKMFDYLGIDYHLVESQLIDDGTFPGIPKPNPENASAMEEGIALAQDCGADLFLATDPDADRLGVAAREAGSVKLLSGNELGLLLLDYLAANNRPNNPLAVTSIVSDPLADSIALNYGIELRRTLTGFKYVGEQIDSLEAKGEANRFMFGFEESCGYLKGSYVRDKDGINAVALTCEMASFYKRKGMTLFDALEDLYARFGYSLNKQINWTLEGTKGNNIINYVVNSFRNSALASIGGFKVEHINDYSHGIFGPSIRNGHRCLSDETLPPSNVIELCLEGEAKVILRPSGTEPKLKVYVFARGDSKKDCRNSLDELVSNVSALVDDRIKQLSEKNIHVILLSGGSGTRLWPLSNSARSKQFLKVLRDQNGNHISMVQRVYSQICKVDAAIDITIATSSVQADSLSMQIPSQYSLVTEPERRDTAPAIMLACANLLLEQGASDDDPVVVMPIDTFADQAYYDKIPQLAKAITASNKDLILLGVEPTYPSEKYGYILPAESEKDGVKDVLSFREKPDEKTAKEYISANALWNCGVFGFKLRFLHETIEKYYVPSNYEDMLSHYGLFPKTSFDYEIVEKAKRIGVISYSGTWKDLGTWNTLTDEMDAAVSGEASVDWNTCNNVHVINETSLPMVIAGLSDSVVVATQDGILVSGKEESAHIKELVSSAARDCPMVESSSWGRYSVLDSHQSAGQSKGEIKRIQVKQSESIDCASLTNVYSCLVVADGTGYLETDNREIELHPGVSFVYDHDASYKINAISDLDLVCVEIKQTV